MSCTVKIKGLNNDQEKTFDSMEAFDLYIEENKDKIKEIVKSYGENLNKLIQIFDINIQDETESKLKIFVQESDRNRLNIVDDKTILYPTSITNYAFSRADIKKPLSGPASFIKYKNDTMDKHRSKYGASIDALKYFENRSNYMKNSGTWFHGYVESLINGTSYTPKYSDLHMIAGSEAETSAKQAAKNIINYIKGNIAGGANWKFMSEVHIGSMKFTPELQALLDEIPELKGKTSLFGRADLIGIDPQGRIHIFDIKTTHKRELSDDANRAAAVQLAFYSEILRSAGFRIGGLYKVPVLLTSKTDVGKVDIAGNAITPDKADFLNLGTDSKPLFQVEKAEFLDELIPYMPTDEVVRTVSRLFGYKSTLSHEKLKDDNNIFRQMFWQIADSESSLKTGEEEIKRQIDKMKSSYAKGMRLQNVSELQSESNAKYEEAIRKGYTYFIWNRDHRILGNDKQIFYFATMAEAEEFLADYITKRNERRAQFYLELKNAYEQVMETPSYAREEALLNLAEQTNFGSKEYIYNLLKTYVLGGWNLKIDDELASNGIFIFNKGDKTEIVSFAKRDLYEKIKLKNGMQTVLQNMILDWEPGTDDTKTMNTLYGNLMTMKMLLLLSRHPDLIPPGSKVQAIRISNIYEEQIIDESVGKASKTWDKFCLYWNDKKRTIVTGPNGEKDTRPELNLLGAGRSNSVIMNPIIAYAQRAMDALELKDNYATQKVRKTLKELPDDQAFSKLLKIAKEFRKEFSELWSVKRLNFNDPVQFAYGMVCSALLEAAQWMPSVEADIASIMDNSGTLDGVRATSPGTSKSATVRILHSMISTYEERLREYYEKDLQDWKRQLTKATEERGTSKSGDIGSFFKEWFDPNEIMTIRRLNDSYFIGKPEERKLAELMIIKFAEYRGISQENIDYTDSITYQIPLLKQDFFDMLRDGSTLRQAAETKFEKVKEIFSNLWNSKSKSNWQARQDENIDVDSIPNYYFHQQQDSRNELFSKYGDVFEKDLDMVMLYASLAYSKNRVSKEFMPYITGLRAVLQLFTQVNGAYEPQIMEAVDDLIKLAVFGKGIMEDNHYNLYRFTQFIKGITSATTLKFNVRNFTRENLADFFRTSAAINASSEFTGYSRKDYENAYAKAVEAFPFYDRHNLFISKIKPSDYADALGIVISSTLSSEKIMLKVSKLNSLYGMANVSQAQLAKYSKTPRLQFDEGYFTTTWPDFFHRNAVLIAYLKKMGAWDAYDINDEGELVYDMSKDNRWKLLFKYNFTQNLKDVDESDRLAYNQVNAAYLENLKVWQRSYPELKVGDRLPHALNIGESNGIRNWCDSLYGSYDDATKALMQSQVLGSMFFQYKNYALSMLSGWWSPARHMTAERLIHMTDEDGNKIYEVVSSPEEYAATGQVSRYVPESEVTQEMLRNNRVQPVTWWEQDPIKGKIQSAYDTMRAVARGDWDYLMKLRESPIERYNLAMILYDSLLMAIIGGLIKLLYGKDKVKNMKNEDFLTRWTYAVLSGVSQDGPFFQTLHSVVGDGSIPTFSTLSTYFYNLQSIITGKRNVAYALLNSFGATRELSSFFNDMRNMVD